MYDNSLKIHDFMIDNLGLRDLELLVYAIIYSFTKDGKSWFVGGVGYIQRYTNKQRKVIGVVLNTLVERGLIVKETTSRYERKVYKTINRYQVVRISFEEHKSQSSKEVMLEQVEEYFGENLHEQHYKNLTMEVILSFLQQYTDWNGGDTGGFSSKKSTTNACRGILSHNDEYSLSYEDWELLIEEYFANANRFSQKGYTVSLNHFLSKGIFKIIYARHFGGVFEEE